MSVNKSVCKRFKNELIRKGCISSTGGRDRLLAKISRVLNIGIGEVEGLIEQIGAKTVQQDQTWKVYLPKK